jgi:hypothetical protein
MHPCLTNVWMKLCVLVLKKIQSLKPSPNSKLEEILVACFLMTREIIKSAAANRKNIGNKRTNVENEWVFYLIKSLS